jgi:predicted MPP superfamily phosphohydrolase
VHISDLHAGRNLPSSYLENLHCRVRAEEPDLIFVTGDFVTRADDIPLLPDILKPLSAPLGCYGILGNHDFWTGADLVSPAVERCGIRLLGHGSTVVTIDGEHRIAVAGCETPWNRDDWPTPDTAGAPLFVLTHTADNAYRLADAGATAAFAGHYHGGQILLPWFGPIVLPSAFGRRFPHGHYVIEGTHIFISAGAGVARPPFRLYCPPDILVVNVRPES